METEAETEETGATGATEETEETGETVVDATGIGTVRGPSLGQGVDCCAVHGGSWFVEFLLNDLLVGSSDCTQGENSSQELH